MADSNLTPEERMARIREERRKAREESIVYTEKQIELMPTVKALDAAMEALRVDMTDMNYDEAEATDEEYEAYNAIVKARQTLSRVHERVKGWDDLTPFGIKRNLEAVTKGAESMEAKVSAIEDADEKSAYEDQIALLEKYVEDYAEEAEANEATMAEAMKERRNNRRRG